MGDLVPAWLSWKSWKFLGVMSLSQDGGRPVVYGQGRPWWQGCTVQNWIGSVTSWGRNRLESDSGLVEQLMLIVIARSTPL